MASNRVPICVWQSRRCRFETANALVVFHVPARHQDPGRRSGFLVAAKRCHYRTCRVYGGQRSPDASENSRRSSQLPRTMPSIVIALPRMY